jgi:predicted alpha/beta superfamily hydrolase
VAVWLPPGYEDTAHRYPVLYMYDGHNCFDPATSYAGVDWQLDEVIVGLAGLGRIEPPVVVAPFTDEYRMEEYWIGPTGISYLRWMTEDLKAFVDSEYRTRPGRDDTAVMGASMGGLASFLAVWEHAEVFSGAGCLSPAFATTHALSYEVAASRWPSQHVTLYIDNGGDEFDTRLQPSIDAMLGALTECRFTDRGTLDWVRDPGGMHHESSWSRRVWRPLELFFGSGSMLGPP